MKRIWESIKANSVGFGIPAILAMNVLIAQNQYSMSGTLGEHGKSLEHISKQLESLPLDVEKALERSEKKADLASEAVQKKLNTIQQNIGASQLDLGNILVSLGVVERGDVFQAVSVSDNIWIVPSPSLRAEIESRGGKFERISDRIEMYGFKMMPVVAVVPQ